MLRDRISHHSPIFQIFDRNVETTRNNLKYKQYYDYCQSNVDSFLEKLKYNLDNSVIENFTTFHNIYKDCIDETCKLEVPKCTKRTAQNNPWITPGLTVSIAQQHQLYDNWVKVRKKACPLGETSTKGGLCQCKICNLKRSRYVKYKEYRSTLKYTRENVKSKYFTGKFLETKGNSKKNMGAY